MTTSVVVLIIAVWCLCGLLVILLVSDFFVECCFAGCVNSAYMLVVTSELVLMVASALVLMSIFQCAVM